MTLTKMTPEGTVVMTVAEASTFLADQAAVAATMQAASFRKDAQAALLANDLVATRCIKAGVPYPPEWLAYDQALRTFIGTGTGSLPERPGYPEGT